MKLTNALLRQHIGWHFRKHWQGSGKRKLVDKRVVESLAEKGIPLYTPKDILEENNAVPLVEEVLDYIPKPIVFDSTHPDWHHRICYTYKDHNVLLEGLNQAKIITKTVEVQEGLPKKYNLAYSPSGIDKGAKQIILNAHLFDCEQQKLPIFKDPTRPAWNFPRTYGITDQRVNKIILSKLLQLVELMSDINTVAERNLLHDLQFSYPFQRQRDLIQLQLRGDMLLTSINPLDRITRDTTEALELPNIFPINYTNTLNKDHIYKIRNIYPIKTFITKSHPHTVFIHYNATEVKNLYEEEVTETQILGRSLMKTFCVAASYAKQRFGEDAGVLPEPVTVQCIHTDGRQFHFGVLQLNTLDLNSENGVKNVWYHAPRIPLFTSCCYKLGKPTLEGYNNNALKHLIAFYNNV